MAAMLLLWMLIMNLQPLPPNPTVNLASVSLYLSCRRWVLLICFQVLIFAFPLNPFEKKFMLILTDNYVVINFYVINERQHGWFLLLLSSVWYHIDKQILYANCPQKNLFYICFFFFGSVKGNFFYQVQILRSEFNKEIFVDGSWLQRRWVHTSWYLWAVLRWWWIWTRTRLWLCRELQ